MAGHSGRIGVGFGRLWAAATTGNLGDGVGRVAVALLAAALTREPFPVAVVTALSYLPWLVFGVPAGVLVDRYDRRRLAAVAGAVRAAAVAVLAVAAATDLAGLWLLYAVVLVLYTCETVYDNAVLAMVPAVVADPADLERANGRVQGGELVADRFAGPPLAGLVFALAAASAFGITVACYAVAALLLLTLPRPPRTDRADSADRPAPRPTLRQELVEGLRYVRGHALHRRLLGMLMLIGFGGAMVNATNVLWTLDVLGVSEAYFGVFTLTMAVGALAGSQTAAAVTRRAGRGRAHGLAVLAAGVGGLVAAASTSPYLAGAGLVVVGWAALVFNVANVSLRQRLTPPELLGRVTGIYRGGAVGVMVLGAFAGGAVAQAGGLRLPWLLFGVAFLAVGGWLLRRLTNQVVDGYLATSARPPATPAGEAAAPAGPAGAGAPGAGAPGAG